MNLSIIFSTNYEIRNAEMSEDGLYVFLHWLPYRRALETGLRSILLDDLIDNVCKAQIDRDAIGFTRNWYSHCGNDFTVFKGISVGVLSEYRLLGRIIEILRLYYAYKKLTSEGQFADVQTDLHPNSHYFGLTNSYFRKCGNMVSVVPPFAVNPFVAATASFNCYDKKKAFALRRWLKNKIEDFKYQENKPSNIVRDSIPGVIFSSHRNESLVLKYLLENHREKIRPILDRKAMPSSYICETLLRRGARVLDDRREMPDSACEDFARRVGDYIQSDSYRDALDESFQDEVLSSTVEQFLLDLVERDFASIAADISHYKVRFEKLNPMAVVVSNDAVEHQRLLVITAREMGIPSVLIQHGHHAEPNDGDKRYADYLAVWGTAVKENYVNEGRNPESVAVTGNPYHDPFSNSQTGNRERVNMILAITHPENRLSAFGEKGLPEKYLEEVLKAARVIDSDVKWIIKLHPSESESYYGRVLKMLKGPGLQMVKKADLMSLLKSCLCVVLPDSTVFTEAYLCGTPIICLNVSGKDFEPPLDGRGSITVVKDFEKLAESINGIMKGPTRREDGYLESYLDSGGQSTRRVAELIMEISKSSTRLQASEETEKYIIKV